MVKGKERVDFKIDGPKNGYRYKNLSETVRIAEPHVEDRCK